MDSLKNKYGISRKELNTLINEAEMMYEIAGFDPVYETVKNYLQFLKETNETHNNNSDSTSND